MIFICFTMVDFPDSPEPVMVRGVSEAAWIVGPIVWGEEGTK